MAFQSDAFQNNAFQITGDATCTPAFNPNAFNNDAFQVCPETGVCTPAFQIGAFLSAAFQVCEEAPVPVPEEQAGGSGAGQPVSSYRPNPFREAIRQANRPQEPTKSKKRKEREQPDLVAGLLAEVADSITPNMIAAEVERLRIIGEYIDELTARAELARQIMQDDEDAMVVLMLAV